MACRERCFLDAIRKNGLVTSNFAPHGFKIDSETAELGPFVCSVAPPTTTRLSRSQPLAGTLQRLIATGGWCLGGATLQTN